MCCFRIGASKGWKPFQSSSIKQVFFVRVRGFFRNFRGTFPSFIYGRSPRGKLKCCQEFAFSLIKELRNFKKNVWYSSVAPLKYFAVNDRIEQITFWNCLWGKFFPQTQFKRLFLSSKWSKRTRVLSWNGNTHNTETKDVNCHSIISIPVLES